MQKLTLAHQTMFADLVQRCHDASFDEQFPEEGSFVRHRRGEKDFWYYTPSIQTDPKRRSIYAGPADDPEINGRVERHRSLKAGYRERRTLVSSLRAIGLPSPNKETGDVVEVLSKAGFFRLRGVMVGTVAFQTYGGLLGTRLEGASLMTGDVDLAQFHSISFLIDDSTPPMDDVLAAVDPTFKRVPHLGDNARSASFENAKGYKVEFLTPNRGSDDNQGRPAQMPALGGIGAEPLRYLDFLIHQPVRSALLHKGGIAVTVPSPERYAIHKLIVSRRRRQNDDGYSKTFKDLHQASLLIEAMTDGHRADDIGIAWMEAWDRGPRWQEQLTAGARTLKPKINSALIQAIGIACLADRSRPEDYGVIDARIRSFEGSR